jgi:hypothetical protein
MPADLLVQLEALGDLLDRTVPPATVDEIARTAAAGGHGVGMPGVLEVGTPNTSNPRRQPMRRLIAVAAVTLLIAGGVVALVARRSHPAIGPTPSTVDTTPVPTTSPAVSTVPSTTASPTTTTVASLSAPLAISFQAWVTAGHLPVLPDGAPRTTPDGQTTFSVPLVSGLTSLRATADGHFVDVTGDPQGSALTVVVQRTDDRSGPRSVALPLPQQQNDAVGSADEDPPSDALGTAHPTPPDEPVRFV